MQVIVYMDFFFFVNFVADGLLLFLSGRLFSCRIRLLRVLLGAGVGAGLSCVLAYVELSGFFMGLPLLLGILRLLFMAIGAYGMTLLCFGGRARTGKLALSVLVTAFAWNGAVTALQVLLRLQAGRLSVLELLLLLLVTVLPVLLLLLTEKRRLVRRQLLFPAELCYHGRSVTARGFLDTGNALYEPLSRMPVLLLDAALFTELTGLGAEQPLDAAPYDARFRLIPYHSVDCEHGVLRGVVLDEVRLSGKDETIVSRAAVAAVSPKPLSREGTYQLLLHPALLEADVRAAACLEPSPSGGDEPLPERRG